MQESTWIRAAALLVAVAQTVAYNTEVWVRVLGCFSFWSANWLWLFLPEMGFFTYKSTNLDSFGLSSASGTMARGACAAAGSSASAAGGALLAAL